MTWSPDRDRLLWVFQRMLDAYGPQHWWPGDGAFEIMVGAILTQNTAWSNVERAIERLQGQGLLHVGAMLDVVAWYATEDPDPTEELWRKDAGANAPYYGGDPHFHGIYRDRMRRCEPGSSFPGGIDTR